MSPRLLLALVITGLLALPPAAVAATKHGITPLAPKAGSSVPAGKSPTFKMRVKGKGQVYVNVCKSRKKDSDGKICPTESIGKAKKKGGSFRYKPKFFDFPEFWLNSPGTYYWQAYRIACEGGNLSDCYQEGPIVKFKVAG
jgi:hypothetical protein